MPDTNLVRLAIALAIGFLIGLERGWSVRTEREGEHAAGIRTHAISGLLGGATALLAEGTSPLILGFVFVGFACVTALFHWLQSQSERNFSATGVVAGMMAFVLGAYAVIGDPKIASAAATATVVLLAMEKTLHRFVARLAWIELRATLVLVTMTFLLLPLLPDHTIDPWDTLNPTRIWEMAIFVCLLSFAGYVAIRLFGSKNGLILAALAGGLVSSTAATLNFARLSKAHPGQGLVMGGAASLASAIMSLRILLLVAVIDSSLVVQLAPTLLVAALIQGAIGIATILSATDQRADAIEWRNPLDLTSALGFAALIAVIMLIASLAARYLGSTGLIGVAALSGLTEVDAITLSLARMRVDGLAQMIAVDGILIAALVNTGVKCAIAAWAGTRAAGLRTSLAALVATAGAAAVFFLVRF